MVISTPIYWINVIAVMGMMVFLALNGNGREDGIALFGFMLMQSIINLTLSFATGVFCLFLKLAGKTPSPAFGKAISAFSLSAGVTFLLSWPMCGIRSF